MNATSFSKGIGLSATSAMAILCGAAGFAATADANPWARVPPHPASCTGENDPWIAKLEAAKQANADEREKQNTINAGIRDRVNNEDPMAKAARMQQAMMDDPQKALEYLQGVQKTGEEINAAAPKVAEQEDGFKAEAKAFTTRYGAAVKTAYAPATARWEALRKKRGYGPEVFHPGEMGEPDWVYAEWELVLRERDKGDQSLCQSWFGAGGQAVQFLDRYKTWLVQVRTPERQKADAVMTGEAGYKSLEPYDAVDLYLTMARQIFDNRPWRARCNAQRCDAMQ